MVVIFDIEVPPLPHPYNNRTIQEIFKVINESGISGSQVCTLVIEFNYSRTSMARTRMARLPRLCRTRS